MDADLRDADGAAFEYHRRYADLQIDLTGSEHLGWASEGTEQGEFDEENDFGLRTGPEHCGMTLGEGRFAVFFPGELHKPSCKTPRLRPRKKSRGQDFDEIICIPQAFPLGGRWPRRAG